MRLWASLGNCKILLRRSFHCNYCARGYNSSHKPPIYLNPLDNQSYLRTFPRDKRTLLREIREERFRELPAQSSKVPTAPLSCSSSRFRSSLARRVNFHNRERLTLFTRTPQYSGLSLGANRLMPKVACVEPLPETMHCGVRWSRA